MKSILCFMVFISLLAITPQAEAIPVLLGTYSEQTSFGFGPSAQPLFGVDMALIYGNWRPGQPCLGCGSVWTDGETGQVDFTATNPFFSFFTSYLTNGRDDFGIGIMIRPIFLPPMANPPIIVENNFESAVLVGGSPDFVGHTVDLIRLTMHDVDIDLTRTEDGRFANAVRMRFDWEFYEGGVQVPEPASVTLLLCGAAMACSVRYFRRRSAKPL